MTELEKKMMLEASELLQKRLELLQYQYDHYDEVFSSSDEAPSKTEMLTEIYQLRRSLA